MPSPVWPYRYREILEAHVPFYNYPLKWGEKEKEEEKKGGDKENKRRTRRWRKRRRKRTKRKRRMGRKRGKSKRGWKGRRGGTFTLSFPTNACVMKIKPNRTFLHREEQHKTHWKQSDPEASFFAVHNRGTGEAPNSKKKREQEKEKKKRLEKRSKSKTERGRGGRKGNSFNVAKGLGTIYITR